MQNDMNSVLGGDGVNWPHARYHRQAVRQGGCYLLANYRQFGLSDSGWCSAPIITPFHADLLGNEREPCRVRLANAMFIRRLRVDADPVRPLLFLASACRKLTTQSLALTTCLYRGNLQAR